MSESGMLWGGVRLAQIGPNAFPGATALVVGPLGPRPPYCGGLEIAHRSLQPVGLLWTRDRPVAENSTQQRTAFPTDGHPYPPMGPEPAIPAIKRPQTYVSERAATGIGPV